MIEIHPVSPSYPVKKVRKIITEREKDKEEEMTHQEQADTPDVQNEPIPHIDEIV